MGRSRVMILVAMATFAGASVVVACAESTNAEADEPDAQVIAVTDDAAVAPEQEDAATDAALPDCDADPTLCNPVTAPCADVDWCPVSNLPAVAGAFTSVWGSGASDVWAVGSKGVIVHYDGAAWSDQSVPTARTLFGVSGSGPDDVWVVGTYGTMYHGPNFVSGKANWESRPIVPYTGAAEKLLTSVWSPPPDQIWLSGGSLKVTGQTSAGTQYRMRFGVDGSDGGVLDNVSPCTGCASVSKVWGTSATDIWSVGPSGKVFHGTLDTSTPDASFVDAGAGLAWMNVASQSTQELRAVWGSSSDDVWIVGRRGTIRRNRAGAAQSEIVDSGTTHDLHGVWGTGPNDVWAVGDYGTILHFDGTQWKASSASLPVGLKPNLYGVWGSAKNDVWVVGEGIVLHFTGAKS